MAKGKKKEKGKADTNQLADEQLEGVSGGVGEFVPIPIPNSAISNLTPTKVTDDSPFESTEATSGDESGSSADTASSSTMKLDPDDYMTDTSSILKT